MPAPATEAVQIPFIDLQSQKERLRSRIDAAIARVLDHGQFIMGPEIAELERQLANFTGARHVVTCSSGTDALALVLMAKGVGPSQAVICPSFTFCATAEVVAWLGATPVFADVEGDTFNISPGSLRAAIEFARNHNLNPTGIIAVDLFGQPADYDQILPIAEREGLFLISDAAQAFGASLNGRAVGTFGCATATSFFPAKPLGCYGDGGAIFTDDADLAKILRSLRVHGQGTDKYDNVRIGMAGRLDTMQAAILIEKLAIFPDEIKARSAVADRYNARIDARAKTPKLICGASSVWAQYTLKVDPDRRAAIIAYLSARGIPTQVYYPRPLHMQTAYQHFPRAKAQLETSEVLAQSVLSLPMHPYLEPNIQDRIISAFNEALRQSA